MHKKILLAPMAGVTDKPYRQLCRQLGADECVSEMITSNPDLYQTRKSQFRRDLEDEDAPRIVQIAGADPAMMAEAARANIDNGADIIDINMGCPAKKVCNAMAGSFLLRDSRLVARILENVVNASAVPVSLKIRTGWDKSCKNAVEIAKIAEQSGIFRLTVHGRTRACRFTGQAEHETTAQIKSEISIEVIANGDISSAEEASRVLRLTHADGVMIGRSAIGNPWIFSEVRCYLQTGHKQASPTWRERLATVSAHLEKIYHHYGEYTGVRIARKHIAKYCSAVPGIESVRAHMIREENCEKQLQYVRDLFSHADDIRMAA